MFLEEGLNGFILADQGHCLLINFLQMGLVHNLTHDVLDCLHKIPPLVV